MDSVKIISLICDKSVRTKN